MMFSVNDVCFFFAFLSQRYGTTLTYHHHLLFQIIHQYSDVHILVLMENYLLMMLVFSYC